MVLDPQLLEILVCPKSKKPLLYFEAEQFLFCPDSRLKYRIEDGIPILLVEEAEELDSAGAEALLERAGGAPG
ncbi:MAG: Trm112 family protein [Proteobacteria bacterium]|nr:Trm112 family protein [Pseudomonadota bacterium]